MFTKSYKKINSLLIFMKFGQHILNIYGQFLFSNGILTKIATCQRVINSCNRVVRADTRP